jgi:hypothetical protein
VAVLLGPAVPAHAALINVGLLSFEEIFAAEGDAAGVNAFNLMNLTGDWALLDDFPIISPIVFTNSTLSVVDAPLGDIGPGVIDFQFTSLEQFSSVTFSAQLASPSFTLADGTVWDAVSLQTTATMLPATGSFVEIGQSVLLTVNAVQHSTPPPPNPVPEPQTWTLLATGVAALARLRHRRGV